MARARLPMQKHLKITSIKILKINLSRATKKLQIEMRATNPKTAEIIRAKRLLAQKLMLAKHPNLKKVRNI